MIGVDLLFIIIILISLWLRFYNLGYSDYQGDEIKALFLPSADQSVYEFLLDQRKGPVQFFITYLLKFLNPDYTNELLIRLPFALAGFLAIFFFYKLIEMHFGRKVAFYAAFFASTNGFFIGLSRIVQYQSFVILFMVLALYMFSLAVYNKKYYITGLYLGFIFWALSILSHYDGVFIAPFAMYLLFRYYKLYKSDLKIGHIAASVFIFTGLLASFYIPFVLSISDATRSYWLNRLSGGGGKISSSRYLFQVYNPIYIIHIYTILFIFGVLKFLSGILPDRLLGLARKVKLFDKEIPDAQGFISVFIWFLIPFVFLELVVNIPGTHIFTYLLPATVVIGFGIVFIENTAKLILGQKAGQFVSLAGVFIIFLFIFLQANAIFVDHTKEYPWENEDFLVWKFHRPSANFHLSMFGFPYYRNWEGIKEFTQNYENNPQAYSTNERRSIVRYYIPYQRTSQTQSYYIYIPFPQSFTDQILNERAKDWTAANEPIKTFKYKNREIAKIYLLPQTVETFEVGE